MDIEDIMRKQISYDYIRHAVSSSFLYGPLRGELSVGRRQRLVRSILDREDDIYDFLGEGGEGDLKWL